MREREIELIINFLVNVSYFFDGLVVIFKLRVVFVGDSLNWINNYDNMML